MSPAALAFEIPQNVPVREEGLWEIDRTGTISDGNTTISIRKVWNICLDAKADRALHELEIREEEANIATMNECCDDSKFTLTDNNILSSVMHCSGPSRIEDRIGKSEIRRSTSFLSDRETRTESTTVNRGGLIESDGRFVTHAKRLGDCPDNQKAGDMMLMHWMVNDEETLKARQAKSIYSEIEFYKTRTASQLAR
ncbi:MAG TPA: DUF3617 family protein [Rhizobiaceae bacterium]|nr:DUF3617 family protein [Rhizobiaceae bacterium]